MKKKSKLISGLRDPKQVIKEKKYFSNDEKHLIIQEWLRTGCTKREIWKKYTGQEGMFKILCQSLFICSFLF